VVSLPRKEYVSLSSNYHHAEKRFQALAIRLERDETLRNVYHDQRLNYIRHEPVEIAPPADGTQETYYLLHHLVRKEKRGNLKWRIVFDGGGPHSTPHVEVSTSGRTSTRQRWRGANCVPENDSRIADRQTHSAGHPSGDRDRPG
jgi:hypothetical protein